MSWIGAFLRRLASDRGDDRSAAQALAERAARSRADASERRGRFLADAGRVLSGSLGREAMLSSVARLAVPFLADWCAVDLVTRDGTLHRVAVAHADPTMARVALDAREASPLDPAVPHGAAEVIRTGRSQLHASRMCVPLVARGQTLGAISFASTGPSRAYCADDLALAEELGRGAALAVDNARLCDELSHLQGRERALLDTALDCIITIDAAGRVVDFNAAAERTFGVTRAGVVGLDLVDLIVPPALRAAHRQGFQRYLDTGETRIMGRRVEMPAVRADGSEFPAELAVTRVAADGPPLFTAYLRDVSERKKAEVAREEAAALRSVAALAAATAHEINTPLAVVVAQTGILAREVGPPAHRRLETIRDAAERIAAVVSDMERIVRLDRVPAPTHHPDRLPASPSRAESPPNLPLPRRPRHGC